MMKMTKTMVMKKKMMKRKKVVLINLRSSLMQSLGLLLLELLLLVVLRVKSLNASKTKLNTSLSYFLSNLTLLALNP